MLFSSEITSTDNLPPGDLLAFKREAMESGLLRVFTKACNDYFHALRPDERPKQPDLVITVSDNLSLYVKRGDFQDPTYNGSKQQAVLMSADGRTVLFEGEIGKGFDRGIVSAQCRYESVVKATESLLAEFDAAIQAIENKNRDDEGPDDRAIAEYFKGKTITLAL